MDKYPIQLREKVDRLIGEMEKCAYLFSKSGEKDFTRKRKIPFSQVIKSLIYMGMLLLPVLNDLRAAAFLLRC